MTAGSSRAARLRELRERARLVPGSPEEAACARAYETFRPLNREVLQLCTDWQVRPGGALNDHSDAAYDSSVIGRLEALDDRAGPVLRRLGDSDSRFVQYGERLRVARDRVVGGDQAWLTSPHLDSYHAVWMELHEELLAALGLEREIGDEEGR